VFFLPEAGDTWSVAGLRFTEGMENVVLDEEDRMNRFLAVLRGAFPSSSAERRERRRERKALDARIKQEFLRASVADMQIDPDRRR
jgi:hypothetical protein